MFWIRNLGMYRNLVNLCIGQMNRYHPIGLGVGQRGDRCAVTLRNLVGRNGQVHVPRDYTMNRLK